MTVVFFSVCLYTNLLKKLLFKYSSNSSNMKFAMKVFLAQNVLLASTYTGSLCELIIPGGLILHDK